MPPLESALAIRRYDEESARARVTRLRIGQAPSAPSLGESPDFSAWLTSLLPPEQRLGPVARALTARAASAMARPAGGPPLGIAPRVGEDGGGPTAPSASQLFGLSWRTLGSEPDAWAGAKLTLAGEEPLSARPIRSSPLRVLREARHAYASAVTRPTGGARTE